VGKVALRRPLDGPGGGPPLDRRVVGAGAALARSVAHRPFHAAMHHGAETAQGGYEEF